MPFEILSEPARSILTRTSGFIAEAGFSHSLTPARNCTFGCSYCYVPTMGIYGGLKPEDVRGWGSRTTYKSNAPELLRAALRPDQVIYCSPLVDPFQPAEAERRSMAAVLEVLAERPPRIFVLQTRGPLILDYLLALRRLSRRTCLRVSFSITTDDDSVRRAYEPHCESIDQRFATVRRLREEGLDVFVTLAPLLPCDPEALMDRALEATANPVLCDPLHNRASKPRGATTRDVARRLSERRGWEEWHDPQFQTDVIARLAVRAGAAGRAFATGPAAFRFLTS